MDIIDTALKSYLKNNYNSRLVNQVSLGDTINAKNRPKCVEGFKEYLKSLEDTKKRVKLISVDLKIEDLKKEVENMLSQTLKSWQKREHDINVKYEDMLDNKIRGLEDEAKEINKKKRRALDESNQLYIDLENKRVQLESYADEVIDICAEYGITTADVDIDNSSFKVEELSEIYDKYLDFMHNKSGHINFISVFRERVPDVWAQAAIILVLFLILLTPIADIVAVLFFIVLMKSQKINKDKVKSFIVLYGLIFNVHPMELGFKDEIDSSELVSESIDEDHDDRLTEISEAWSKELEELDKDNPDELINEVRANLISRALAIKRDFDSKVKSFYKDKESIIKLIDAEIQGATDEFEKLKSKVQYLGDAYSKSYVLNTQFALGLRDGIIEERYDVGLRNIIIHPSTNEALHKRFIQVLFANAMCNVSINLMTAIICDPNRQGQELIGFYHSKLEQNIKFSSDPLEKVIQDLKVFATNNLKQMKELNIQDFNEEADRLDKTPREYRLLIVLSQPKKLEEDEALIEFMQYSANLGVLIWLVSTKELPNTTIFRTPFEGVRNPYIVDGQDLAKRTVKTLLEAKKNTTERALAWKKFCSVASKDENIWTKHSDNCVELIPGFQEGDPDKPIAYTFGNQGNVHMIGVGGTGAGKSVFLNFLICQITRNYSPYDLELWLIDFKGNEFSKYLAKEGHPNMLPHMAACLCTSDGDFASSVFKELRRITEYRFKYLDDRGFKNIKQWNERCRAENREDNIWPRILCINDEFQVIYRKAESAVVDQINEDIEFISKLGRAAGVHLFFTSQSMKGTINADVLQQFTLRFVLRCDEEVSTAVLGAKNSSEIKQSNGYLWVRSQEDVKPEDYKRYKTPYLCDESPDAKHPDRVDELQAHIDEMAERAKKIGFKQKNVITYKESDTHSIDEINQYYESQTSENKPSGLFILGRRMVYSSNKVPENIVMACENNTHIFSAFENTVDLFNFYKSIKRNIDLQQDAAILINCQVKNLGYICELDKDYEGTIRDMSSEKVTPSLFYNAMLKPIYEARVKANNKSTPIYVICIGWDKCVGFGIDKDIRVTNDYATFIQVCGEYNIHFIFICSGGVNGIQSSIIAACKYRIVGKVSEQDSYKVIESKLGSKSFEGIKSGYMFLNRSGSISRLKIYQSVQEREIIKDEIVLE